MMYDLAILLLSRPVLQHDAGLACLASPGQDLALDSCMVTGWGRENILSTISPLLQKSLVPLVDYYTCQAALRGGEQNTTKHHIAY